MFFLNVYSLKGLSAWQFPWTWTDCLRGGGRSRIITIAQKKLNAGDFFTVSLRSTCISLHTETVSLSQFHGRLLRTHRWSYVVSLTKCWNGRQKHKNRWWWGGAPVLLSYWVISMSVWWCIRVQIFFNDRCATVVFLKQWFSRSLRLVLVLYSSLSYQ